MLSIRSPYTDIFSNLAAEEYFLKHFSEDIFMLYRDEPSVVVGRYQDVLAEVNLDFVIKNNIGIARRISGGGSVFHDQGNLNLVFIENTDTPRFSLYSSRILDFLQTLEIPAEVDERNSISCRGLKISGSAQYIFRQRVMYHATLLYTSDIEMLTGALDVETDTSIENQKKWVKSVRSPVNNISGFLEKPFSLSAFEKKVFEYFSGKDRTDKTYLLNSNDISSIEELKSGKYATRQWIYDMRVPRL